jgi:signal peptidase
MMMPQNPKHEDETTEEETSPSPTKSAHRLFGARSATAQVPATALLVDSAVSPASLDSDGVAKIVARAPALKSDVELSSIEPPHSKIRLVVEWSRKVIATAVVLVILLALGIGTLALVRGTWQVNPVLSGSMRPGFAVGSVVISERIPVNQLVLRDVIEFRNPTTPSEVMVHRIVQILKGKSGQLQFRTRGDANTVRDPWTLNIRGHFIYRVRWAIPLIGYVAVAFQNNRGIYLLVAGFFLLLVAIMTLVQSRRRDGVESLPDDQVIGRGSG